MKELYPNTPIFFINTSNKNYNQEQQRIVGQPNNKHQNS
jgi:hypothetical protein